MEKQDEELTRKAIEEILREAKEYKERDQIRPNQERKINPLQKANKHFLGRTINAAVKHNERTDEQTRRKCRKKLRELDKHRPQSRSKSIDDYKRNRKHKMKDRRSSHDDSLDRESSKQLKSKRKKKHKRKKHTRRDSSNSSRSSSKSDFSHNRTTNRDVEDRCPNHIDFKNEVTAMDMQNYASMMMQPLYWTASMQQIFQFKALMEIGAAQANMTETVQIDALSVSSSSLSDVNCDEVTESKPCSNLMLTINLSTEDEEDSYKVTKQRKKTAKKNRTVSSPCIEVSDSDSDASTKMDTIINLTDSEVEENCGKTISDNAVNDLELENVSEKNVITLKPIVLNVDVDLTEE